MLCSSARPGDTIISSTFTRKYKASHRDSATLVSLLTGRLAGPISSGTRMNRPTL
jgi:hypothetical protein